MKRLLFAGSKKRARAAEAVARKGAASAHELACDLARIQELVPYIVDEAHYRNLLAQAPNDEWRTEIAKLLEPLLPFQVAPFQPARPRIPWWKPFALTLLARVWCHDCGKTRFAWRRCACTVTPLTLTSGTRTEPFDPSATAGAPTLEVAQSSVPTPVRRPAGPLVLTGLREMDLTHLAELDRVDRRRWSKAFALAFVAGQPLEVLAAVQTCGFETFLRVVKPELEHHDLKRDDYDRIYRIIRAEAAKRVQAGTRYHAETPGAMVLN